MNSCLRLPGKSISLKQRYFAPTTFCSDRSRWRLRRTRPLRIRSVYRAWFRVIRATLVCIRPDTPFQRQPLGLTDPRNERSTSFWLKRTPDSSPTSDGETRTGVREVRYYNNRRISRANRSGPKLYFRRPSIRVQPRPNADNNAITSFE